MMPAPFAAATCKSLQAPAAACAYWLSSVVRVIRGYSPGSLVQRKWLSFEQGSWRYAIAKSWHGSGRR